MSKICLRNRNKKELFPSDIVKCDIKSDRRREGGREGGGVPTSGLLATRLQEGRYIKLKDNNIIHGFVALFYWQHTHLLVNRKVVSAHISWLTLNKKDFWLFLSANITYRPTNSSMPLRFVVLRVSSCAIFLSSAILGPSLSSELFLLPSPSVPRAIGALLILEDKLHIHASQAKTWKL